MVRPGASKRIPLLVAVGALLAAACTGPEEQVTVAPPTSAPTTEAATTATSSSTTSSTTSTTTVASSLEKPYGGEAVYGLAQEPPTLNPLVPGGNSPIVDLVGQLWWAGIYEIDAITGRLVPDVVVALPTPENGGVAVGDDGSLTVRYEIREDAVWADGTPISGADLEFTLKTILDPANKVNTSVYEDIVDYEAGDKTFEFVLAVPSPQYELLFDVILPKHDVDGTSFAADWNDATWVSGGPFVFEEWVPGEVIRFSRNDRYWKLDAETGQRLPYLDRLELRLAGSAAELMDLFAARQVDALELPATMTTMERLSALESEGAVVETVAAPIWEHLAFQFGPGRFDRNPASVNDSLDFRRAVAHAIDRRRLVEAILPGELTPLDSFVDVFAPELSTRAWSRYGFDPDLARRLIQSLQSETGAEQVVAFFSSTADDEARAIMAELLQEMLGDVGIELDVGLDDAAFLEETLPLGSWDLASWAWGTRGPGVAGLVALWDVFDPDLPPPKGQNYYRWGTDDSAVQDEATARFAAIRDEINRSIDPGVIAPLMAEAEALLAESLVFIPLFQRLELGAHWPDVVTGPGRVVSGSGGTWNAALWHRAE